MQQRASSQHGECSERQESGKRAGGTREKAPAATSAAANSQTNPKRQEPQSDASGLCRTCGRADIFHPTQGKKAKCQVCGRYRHQACMSGGIPDAEIDNFTCPICKVNFVLVNLGLTQVDKDTEQARGEAIFG